MYICCVQVVDIIIQRRREYCASVGLFCSFSWEVSFLLYTYMYIIIQ